MSPHRQRNAYLIVIGALLLMALVAFTGWRLADTGTAPPAALCNLQMRQIFKAIEQYAATHSGAVPHDFDTLTNEQLLAPDQLICPTDAQSVLRDSVVTDGKLPSSYVLIRMETPLEQLDSMQPLVVEKQPNHYGGGFVLYADGHIVWMPAAPLSHISEHLPDK